MSLRSGHALLLIKNANGFMMLHKLRFALGRRGGGDRQTAFLLLSLHKCNTICGKEEEHTHTDTQNKKTKRSCKEKHKKCAALKQISVSFCSAPFFSALTKMGRTVQNKTSWQPHATAWQAPFKHSPLSAAVVLLPPAQLCLLLPENCQRWGFML